MVMTSLKEHNEAKQSRHFLFAVATVKETLFIKVEVRNQHKEVKLEENDEGILGKGK